MWLRKAFYWVQIVAVVLVPLWIAVAVAIAPDSLGAQTVFAFIAWPSLLVGMAVVLGITWARKSVRSARTLSWLDVAALATWYAVAIAYGVVLAAGLPVAAGLLGGALMLVSIAVFALAIWQLVVAARRRVQTVFASLDQSAVKMAEYGSSRDDAGRGRGDGNVIRIESPRR